MRPVRGQPRGRTWNQRWSLRSGAILLLMLTLAVLSPAALAGEGGMDPSLALWGSSAVALVFTVGGSLFLAQYHRAVGAVDGRLAELRHELLEQRKLLAGTREDYTRRDETTTLRNEMRAETNALRSEVAALRQETQAELKAVRADLGKILSLLNGGAR